jgi:mono/diheme cytochrome c family protein
MGLVIRAGLTTVIAAGLAGAAGVGAARAQKAGDPEAGLAFARRVCAECHAVDRKDLGSPRVGAPSFQRIANTPGMTETALYVTMQTPHRTMPNVRLEAKEMRDVVAYLVSLQGPP